MGTWIARVEWRTPDTYDEPALDLVTEHLADHDGTIARESGPYAALEVWSATVTITGTNSLRRATTTALELVEGATGEKPVGVEVLPVEIYDQRVDHPSIPDLVGYAEIADLLGVSRQRAAQLADLPTFPPAVVETKSGPLRVRSQVEGWASTWERKGGRPRKIAEPSSMATEVILDDQGQIVGMTARSRKL